METKTLHIDTKDLAVNQSRVQSEKNYNTIVDGIIIGTATACVGFLLTRGKFADKCTIATVASGIAGTVGGGLLGRTRETREEGTSKSLLKAASSGSFAETIKREMKSRESSAYLEGVVIGAVPWFI